METTNSNAPNTFWPFIYTRSVTTNQEHVFRNVCTCTENQQLKYHLGFRPCIQYFAEAPLAAITTSNLLKFLNRTRQMRCTGISGRVYSVCYLLQVPLLPLCAKWWDASFVRRNKCYTLNLFLIFFFFLYCISQGKHGIQLYIVII